MTADIEPFVHGREPSKPGRRRRAVLVLLAGLAVGVAAPAATRGIAPNPVDREFVRDETRAGDAAQMVNRFVARRAANPRVREFARRLLDEQGRVQLELQRVVREAGLGAMVPLRPDAALQRLQRARGPALDRQYQEWIYLHLRHSVMRFKKEAREGAHPALKSFAARALPQLNTQLKLAQQGDRAWAPVGAAANSEAR